MNCDFFTPVVTAFTKAGDLDIEANQKIYQNLIDGGIEGIVLLGSTGEFFAMSKEQKKELIELACTYVDNQIPILVGTGDINVDETIELSNYAIQQGAQGVLIVPPYYFGLSETYIENYYSLICQNFFGSIYFYNFPDRTGYDLSPELTLKLVEKYSNIVGYKDTVLNFDHTRELIKTIKPKFPNFKIYSGFDDNFLHNVMSGGDGCIGGLSNIAPTLFSQWITAIREECISEMHHIQRRVDQLTSLYGISKPFIPTLKASMKMMGVELEDYCTKPIKSVEEEQKDKIRIILKLAEIL